MKKIFLFLFALSATLYANAQVNVTLQVDVTKMLQDTIMFPAGMRVGGTFATNGAMNGSVAMKDWTPGDTASKMINMGDSIWSITITLPSGNIGDTLYFKFIDGTWFSAGKNEDEGSDLSLITGGCGKGPNNQAANGGNRILVIPAANITYRWCYDSCVQCNGGNPVVTGVQQLSNKISVFSLSPNPAVNKHSTLMYSVSQYSPVNLSLYNVLGQSVKTFVNTNRPSGIYNQPIDLSGLNAGVYFIQLTSGSQTIAKKVVVE